MLFIETLSDGTNHNTSTSFHKQLGLRLARIKKLVFLHRVAGCACAKRVFICEQGVHV